MNLTTLEEWEILNAVYVVGESKLSTSKKYGVSRKQVYRIVKDFEKLSKIILLGATQKDLKSRQKTMIVLALDNLVVSKSGATFA